MKGLTCYLFQGTTRELYSVTGVGAEIASVATFSVASSDMRARHNMLDKIDSVRYFNYQVSSFLDLQFQDGP